MKQDLMAAFANKLGVSLRKPTADEESVLSALSLPATLHEMLMRGWFASYSDYGGLEFFDVGSICDEVRQKYIEDLPKAGHLPIGKAGNGDQLVIRFGRSGFPVGYIRIAFWGGGEPSEKSFVIIEETLASFLLRGIRRKSLSELVFRRSRFPLDSYDAEKEK
jgi:hypothetical protein